MKRIKVFNSDYKLQDTIDQWISQNNPDIISISSSMACSGHGSTYILITILYEDRKDEIKL